MDNRIDLDSVAMLRVFEERVNELMLRNVHLETAVQQLLQEKQQLEMTLEALKTAADEAAEEKS